MLSSGADGRCLWSSVLLSGGLYCCVARASEVVFVATVSCHNCYDGCFALARRISGGAGC